MSMPRLDALMRVSALMALSAMSLTYGPSACQPSPPSTPSQRATPPQAQDSDGPNTPDPLASAPEEPSTLDITLEGPALEATDLQEITDQSLGEPEAPGVVTRLALPKGSAWALRAALFERDVAILSPLDKLNAELHLVDLSTGKTKRTRPGRFVTASARLGVVVYATPEHEDQLVIHDLQTGQEQVVRVELEGGSPRGMMAHADEALWVMASRAGARTLHVGRWTPGQDTVRLSEQVAGRLEDVSSGEQGQTLLQMTRGVGERLAQCTRYALEPQGQVRCLSAPSAQEWRFGGDAMAPPTLTSPTGQLVRWMAPTDCELDLNAHLTRPASALLRCMPSGAQAPRWWIWTAQRGVHTLMLPQTARVTRGELDSSTLLIKDLVLDLQTPKLWRAPQALVALHPKTTPRASAVLRFDEAGAPTLWWLDVEQGQLTRLAAYEDCGPGRRVRQDGASPGLLVLSCHDQDLKRSASSLGHRWTEVLDVEQRRRVRMTQGFPEAMSPTGALLMSDRATRSDKSIGALWVTRPFKSAAR